MLLTLSENVLVYVKVNFYRELYFAQHLYTLPRLYKVRFPATYHYRYCSHHCGVVIIIVVAVIIIIVAIVDHLVTIFVKLTIQKQFHNGSLPLKGPSLAMFKDILQGYVDCW